MTYKSMESRIRDVMIETRKSQGKKALEAWQKRVNARVDDLQKSLPKKDEGDNK